MEKIMTNPQKSSPPETGMDAMEAIYRRRAVRDYTPETIDQVTVRSLLDAAVHAPTAMHEEPWAFAVVQDKTILNRLSDHIKELLAGGTDLIHPLGGIHATDIFTTPEFNVFYNAGTLIVICGKPMGSFVISDCWLAAENLMLAACAKGLATCPIGLAVTALNTPEWKKELGIPAEMTAFAPIIVGVPAGISPPVPRKQPEILTWK
jgi:nitroreductase